MEENVKKNRPTDLHKHIISVPAIGIMVDINKDSKQEGGSRVNTVYPNSTASKERTGGNRVTHVGLDTWLVARFVGYKACCNIIADMIRNYFAEQSTFPVYLYSGIVVSSWSRVFEGFVLSVGG